MLGPFRKNTSHQTSSRTSAVFSFSQPRRRSGAFTLPAIRELSSLTPFRRQHGKSKRHCRDTLSLIFQGNNANWQRSNVRWFSEILSLLKLKLAVVCGEKYVHILIVIDLALINPYFTSYSVGRVVACNMLILLTEVKRTMKWILVIWGHRLMQYPYSFKHKQERTHLPYIWHTTSSNIKSKIETTETCQSLLTRCWLPCG